MNNLKTSIILCIFYLSSYFSSSYAHPILTTSIIASQNHYRSNTNHYYQQKLKRERYEKSRHIALQQKRKSGRKLMLASMNLEEKENFLQMETRSRIKGKLNNELDILTKKFLKRIESLWLNSYLPEAGNMVKNEKGEAYLDPEDLDNLKIKNNTKAWVESLDQLVEKYYYLIDEELEEIAYEIDGLSWDIDDSMVVEYIENQKEKMFKGIQASIPRTKEQIWAGALIYKKEIEQVVIDLIKIEELRRQDLIKIRKGHYRMDEYRWKKNWLGKSKYRYR